MLILKTTNQKLDQWNMVQWCEIENRKSFYNIDLTYKSDVSKFAMNDVDCVGDVERVDKFINAYNSDNYLFIPKFLRSRKS